MSQAGELLVLAVPRGTKRPTMMQKQDPRDTPRPRPRPILRVGVRRGGGAVVAFAMEKIAGVGGGLLGEICV